VLDLETTGLTPALDRIVEVAVVTTDPIGGVLEEWSVLVDPGRDPGPTEVHGITERHLDGATAFVDVVPGLRERLDGSVIVAHNLAFDAAFLATEAERAGVALLAGVQGGLCTLDVSRSTMGRPSDGWSLGSLCATFGVPLVDPHRALVDARATAGLLAALLAELPASRPRLLTRRLTLGR
jgi:DNA polymerase III subunit epsilon